MDRYELKEDLGNGSFGRVIKARHRDTGNIVAIKHMKRKFQSWKEIVHIREVSSLRNMSHPNIVHIQEVILERDENLYFVFEYMAGGSLYELMKRCIENAAARKQNSDKYDKEDQPLLSSDKIRIYVQQILNGLSYIHDRGYIHRDIKPENILLHENGSGCKIADFGLARRFSSSRQTVGDVEDGNNNRQLTYYVSTRWYRAPEVILRCSSYGTPIDLFATGLVLAELHSLRPLFPGTSEIDQLTKIVALLGPPSETLWEEGATRMKQLNFSLVATTATATEFPSIQVEGFHLNRDNVNRVEAGIRRALPEYISSRATTLIRQLIAWNPSTRLSAKDALKHDYFQPFTVLRREKYNGARWEDSEEQVLNKSIGSSVMEKSFAVEPRHLAFRHNVGEIIIKQGAAASSEYRGFQLEQDQCQNPEPFDVESQYHPFLHNVEEITAEERAGSSLFQHECFQTMTLPLNASSESRSRRFELHQDENSIPIEEAPICRQFCHNVCEMIIEQPRFSNAATLTNNSNPPMSTMIVRQENEFCNYLEAISNSSEHGQLAQNSSYNRADHPFGNSLQPIVEPSMQTLFHTGFIGVSAASPIMRTPQIAHTSKTSSIMQREMTTIIRRDRVSNRANHYGSNSRQSLQSQRTALAEKPRWLLSNQNMGRGAMEVCVSRTVHPNIIERGWKMGWDNVVEKDRSSKAEVHTTRECAVENPFECFDIL